MTIGRGAGRLVLDISEADDPAEVGEEALDLGGRARDGLPVPAGFCVTTCAYRLSLIGISLPTGRAARGASRAALLHEALLTAPVPPDVRHAITRAWAELGRPAVAVRASAATGDSSPARAAGRRSAALLAVGEKGLLDAIRRCWASLWDGRTAPPAQDGAGRARSGRGPDEPAAGVVVQTLVDADVAGALFTRDPLSGGDDIVVTASYGLSESVAPGAVTPDVFQLSRDGRVLERTIGAKRIRVDLGADGAVTSPVPPDDRVRPCLDPPALRALAGLGQRAERHDGTPQDIEWALAGDRLHLLRAGPITAVAHQPQRAGPEPASGSAESTGSAPPAGPLAALARLVRHDLLTRMPSPVPLNLVMMRRLAGAALGLLDEAGLGRGRAEDLLTGDDDGVLAFAPPPLRAGPGTPLALARLTRRVLTVLTRDCEARARDETRIRARTDRLRTRAERLAEATDAEALAVVDDAVELAGRILELRYRHCLLPMILTMIPRYARAGALIRFAARPHGPSRPARRAAGEPHVLRREREGALRLLDGPGRAARRAVDEIASRLAAAGTLTAAEDVSLLYYEEVCDALEGARGPRLHETIRRRRRAQPRALAQWRRAGGLLTPFGTAGLRGLPGGGGAATGTARVGLDPGDLPRLRPGEVLVCPYAGPAWTHLLTAAGAVVTDTGGPLSGPAIIAREHGIPAVLGTNDATAAIRDGARLLVDGDAGRVDVLDGRA